MSYEKQTWVYKDEITAEKLNHMEQGIADASQGGGGTPLIVNQTTTVDGDYNVITLDKTWREIKDAFPNVILHTSSEGFEAWDAIYGVYYEGEESAPYEVRAQVDFTTSSEDGYPSNRAAGGGD